MANAIVTLKIMPESTEIDLEKVQDEVTIILDEMVGEGDRRATIEPVAFGLNALKMIFVVDEKKGSPDPIAERILDEVKGVQSCDIIDVRRAVG